MLNQIDCALRIVGPEDFSSEGESGQIIIEGELAAAIVEQIWSSPEYRTRQGLDNQPVRLSRMGGLEIWCNGTYVEGRGVRRIIYQAVRQLRKS